MDFIKILLYAISPGLRKDIVTFVLSLKDKKTNPKYPLDPVIIDIFIKTLNIKE